MTVITALIIVIILVFIAGAGVIYFNKKEQVKLLPSGKERTDVVIEAIGGFSSGRITTLSTSAVPGMPYDISLFSGKTPFIPVIIEGIKKKKTWRRHGEIKPATIGMNRF